MATRKHTQRDECIHYLRTVIHFTQVAGRMAAMEVLGKPVHGGHLGAGLLRCLHDEVPRVLADHQQIAKP